MSKVIVPDGMKWHDLSEDSGEDAAPEDRDEDAAPEVRIETVVPEGRGKAEAARTFLATGGGLRSRGGTRQSGFRYTKGILKGKTKEEAQSMFEDRWAGASGAIKDKYAKRGSNAGVLAPSEMAEMKPQAGVEYGTISGVSKPGPAPATKATTAITTTTTSTDAAQRPMGAQESRMKLYADQRASRMAYHAPAPQTQPQAKRSALPASMTPRSSFVGPPRPRMIPTGIPGQSRQAYGPLSPEVMEVLSRKPGMPRPGSTPLVDAHKPDATGLNPLAQREIAKRKAAVAETPTGRAVMRDDVAMAEGVVAGRSVNRLTGLPFGFQPGDQLPNSADGKMQRRADASTKRMQIETSKAAMPPVRPFSGISSPSPSIAPQKHPMGQARPFTGISNQQPPAPTGYAGPRTRYTPGMGHVPVATPVTNGDEQISYGTYDAARTRMKTPGGTSGQDKQDATLMTEFNRQAMKRIGKNDTVANRLRR